MEEIVEFEYLEENTVNSHVMFNRKTGEVKIEDFNDDPLCTFMGYNEHTIPNIMRFLQERCFPETRADRDVLLELLGLRVYNPLDIVRKTHGRMVGDFFWIRFKGENLIWEDFPPREASDETKLHWNRGMYEDYQKGLIK